MVEALGPARPPTPPRTSSRTLSQENAHSCDSPVPIQTPGGSGAHEIDSAAPSTRSKRVNFSLSPKFIKPPTFTNSSKTKSDLKVLTPSNECRPVKSILKATQSPIPPSHPNVTANTPEALAMLLESVARQLAGESISSRLDAYMQLCNALKAYEGVLGEQEVAAKLGLIVQFMQRDMGRNSGNDGPLDTNLAILAWKLSAVFLWRLDLSARLPDEFKTFLVDHSIACLQDEKMPKSVLNQCMFVLSSQNFSAKIMTNTRLNRLLSALQVLNKGGSSRAVVSQRLSIYQRLLSQSKSTFVSQSALWMEHLVSGLLHTEKEIRHKAIYLGSQVSMTAGPNSTLSKSLRDFLDRPLDEDRKMVEEVRGRMFKMMANHDEGAHVPQVWSIVILLLRSKNYSIDRWEHFKNWVLIIQECFNRSESTIKAQAMLGWNRFVFAITPNEPTSRNLSKMLRKPILSQLERKKQDKNGVQPTRLALSSYYNLLYYAFRPSASPDYLDVAWEEYVFVPASTIFGSIPILSDRFSQALSSLLWSSQGKVWTENKAIETNKFEPEDLPSLDSKWVRSRVASVLKVFESIFKSSVWVYDAIDKSNIAIAWTSLCNALSHASSKEITPSAESMQAVAHVLGLLQRIWTAGPPSLNAVEDQNMDRFLDRFRFLSTSIISSLGSIPFTEKLLLKTTDETFQIANTPTHRHPQQNSNLVTPIVHFLLLVSGRPGMLEPNSAYSLLIDSTLEAACNGKGSRSSCLELLRHCAELCQAQAESRSGVTVFAQVIWKATAKLAQESFGPIESARERDESASRDYENIMGILCTGLRFSDVSQEWNQLLDSLIRVVSSERGYWAVTEIIVEPLAESLMGLEVQFSYLPLTALVTHASFIHQNAPNGPDQVYPQKLVDMIDKTLRASYENSNPSDVNELTAFIESLCSFLESGALSFRSASLEGVQDSISLWMEDGAQQLNIDSEGTKIFGACHALVTAVLNVLRSCTPHDAICLQKFETIVCAGLLSPHMPVARGMMDMWSSTFGLQASLTLPECVSRSLEKSNANLKSHPAGLSQPAASEARDSTTEESKGSRDVSQINDPAVFRDSFEPESSITSAAEIKETVAASAKQPDFQRQEPPSRSPSVIGTEPRLKRNQLFSMVHSIRSASPASAAQGRGMKASSHIHDLHNQEPGTPPTPSLPAVMTDNDDVFLGSSPTPGSRNRKVLDLPSSTTRDRATLGVDPPSSPPEMRASSPNVHNQDEPFKFSDMSSPNTEAREADSVKRKPKYRNSSLSISTPVSNRRTSQDNSGSSKQSASKPGGRSNDRPRSASGRFIKSPSVTNSSKHSVNRPRSASGRFVERHNISQEPDSSPSKGRRAENRDRGAKSKSEDTPTQKSTSKTSRHDESIDKPRANGDTDGESSSDDMESQIASQLGQDLELAVDQDEQHNADETDLPSTYPMTKKRKREVEESHKETTKGRRRSSRRASPKEPTPEPQGVKTIRTRRSVISSSVQEPSSNSPPSEPAPKKRKRRSEGSNTDQAKQTDDPKQPDHSQEDESGKEKKDSEPTQKRRKSSRLSGQDIPEEGSSQAKLPRRARKKGKNKSNKAQRSQPEATPTQESSVAPEQAVEERSDPQKGEEKEDSQRQESETGTDLGVVSQEPQPESEQGDAAVLRSLRGVLDEVRLASLNMDSLKEVDDLLFEIRVQAHEALRRPTSG